VGTVPFLVRKTKGVKKKERKKETESTKAINYCSLAQLKTTVYYTKKKQSSYYCSITRDTLLNNKTM
jgi:hypothetical protein